MNVNWQDPEMRPTYTQYVEARDNAFSTLAGLDNEQLTNLMMMCANVAQNSPSVPPTASAIVNAKVLKRICFLAFGFIAMATYEQSETLGRGETKWVDLDKLAMFRNATLN